MAIATSTIDLSLKAVVYVGLSLDDPLAEESLIEYLGKTYTLKSRLTEEHLRCPLCFHLSTPPMIICVAGHSSCNGCAGKLKLFDTKECPICDQALLSSFFASRLPPHQSREQLHLMLAKEFKKPFWNDKTDRQLAAAFGVSLATVRYVRV